MTHDLPEIEPLLAAWERDFLEVAKRDGYQAWKEELPEGQPLEKAGEARARRQVQLVRETAQGLAFGPEGGEQAVRRFLEQQTYRPEASSARYVVHVYGGEQPAAMVYADRIEDLDLVEMLGDRMEGSVAVALRDPDEKLEPFELDELQQAILEDLYFDYDEDRLSVAFERYTAGLVVRVAPLGREAPTAASEEAIERETEAWLA
ncbi:MAG: hypothetical protein D6776_08515, partial [Planctomycetota bacterium]